MGHPMKLELTRVGLLVKLANRYTTKGAQLQNRNKRVRTPVMLLRSLSDKYLWERYEPSLSSLQWVK